MMCFVLGGVEAFSPFLLQCFLFIGEAMKGQNLSLSLMIFQYFSIEVIGLPSQHVGHITTRWAPSQSLVHGVPLYKAENKWETVVITDPEIRGAMGPHLITGRGPPCFCFDSSKLQKNNTSIQRSTPPPLLHLRLFAGELFVYNIGFLATLRRCFVTILSLSPGFWIPQSFWFPDSRTSLF